VSGRAKTVSLKGGVAISRDRLHARSREIAAQANTPKAWPIVALLACDAPSGFTWKNAAGLRFPDCATTDHIAVRLCEIVGDHSTDREFVRDNRIRPLRAIGVVDCVIRRGAKVLDGHLVPNSPDNSYRLSQAAMDALAAPEAAFQDYLCELRNGAHAPEDIEADARGSSDAPHIAILTKVRTDHLPRFHEGFDVLWTDDEGGSLSVGGRQSALASHGFVFVRGDAIPDMILFEPASRRMRFVEAIASGGEPDTIKHEQLRALCARWAVTYDGTVCAYATRKAALSRRALLPEAARLSHAWSASHPDILETAVSSWPSC